MVPSPSNGVSPLLSLLLHHHHHHHRRRGRCSFQYCLSLSRSRSLFLLSSKSHHHYHRLFPRLLFRSLRWSLTRQSMSSPWTLTLPRRDRRGPPLGLQRVISHPALANVIVIVGIARCILSARGSFPCLSASLYPIPCRPNRNTIPSAISRHHGAMMNLVVAAPATISLSRITAVDGTFATVECLSCVLVNDAMGYDVTII